MLVRNGVRYVTGKQFKLDVQQFLANQAVKDIVHGGTILGTRLGSEIIGKRLGRLPFVTRRGHLVASSGYVEPGDIVALIGSTQVPFVLRRDTYGLYRLISEAYVDGIMDEETAEASSFGVVELV